VNTPPLASPPQQQTRPAQQSDPAQLLEQVLQRTSDKIRAVSTALEARTDIIEELLPGHMKGQGRRLAKRALMTLSRNAQLAQCPAPDFVRLVLEAAEIGLAIDGKLGYVVKYKGAYEFQADYKGLIAVARRSGLILDAYGDVVCRGDVFEASRNGPDASLRHSYDLNTERGECIGAYAVVTLPNGRWRYEVMTRKELDGIQNRAPAKNGPWRTDTDQMRIKTVLRRLLKLYIDDPGFMRAWDGADALEEVEEETPAARPEAGRVNLRQNGAAPQNPWDVPGAMEPYREPVQEQNQEPQPAERQPGQEG
jgi:phage RecT family recombinase